MIQQPFQKLMTVFDDRCQTLSRENWKSIVYRNFSAGWIVRRKYADLCDDALSNVTTQERVFIQSENLWLHHVIAAALASSRRTLHGWVYKIETRRQVFFCDSEPGQFLRLTEIPLAQVWPRPCLTAGHSI